MSIAVMSRRSMTSPPSAVLWPAPLCPPLRTASGQAGVAGESDRARYIGVVDRPDDDGRPRIGAAEHDGAGTVIPLVGRADHAAVDLGLQLRQGDCCHGKRSFTQSPSTSVLAGCDPPNDRISSKQAALTSTPTP
jgi:hypothetical protein